MKQLSVCVYKSPIGKVGKIQVFADGEQLCLLDFEHNEARIEKLLRRRYGEFETTRKADMLDMQNRLAYYFSGDWSAFDELKSAQVATAGTDFQRRVWNMLSTIPVGSTMSYSELAAAINRPKAIRAVASANANNPLPIIIPCHRVIGKNGKLRGYAGGTTRQSALLKHEGFL